mgnify:CR=1 FL=1
MVLLFLIIIAVITMFSIWLLTLTYIDYSKKQSCNNYESMTGIKTTWVNWDACYIHTDNGWRRWDEYKMRMTH